MPTYALLGATGATGSSILRCLLSQPPQDLTLNVFIRSKSKLLGLFPDLENTKSFKVNIVEGTPSNAAALQHALRDADVIFMCIASNVGRPGTTLTLDTATSIVAALKTLREEQGAAYHTPTILQLRSVQQNEIFQKQASWLAKLIISLTVEFANYYVYKDVNDAYELYVQAHKADPKNLEYISVDPPAIMDGEGTTPTGYELTVDHLPANHVVSYADLGAAFVEIAERRREFAFKGVGVGATGHVNMTFSKNLQEMGTSVWARVFG